MGRAEIHKWLRHRFPMIFVDRVVDYDGNRQLTAISAISGTSEWAQGHFPDRAIYPGTNILQAFSQAAIVLLQLVSTPLRDDELTVVTSIEARFLAMVVPGDMLTYQAKLDREAGGVFFFSGSVERESRTIAKIRVRIARRDVEVFAGTLW
jgi:3-hydroxyacyl-[acyl-carrier-protein] dehydratase